MSDEGKTLSAERNAYGPSPLIPLVRKWLRLRRWEDMVAQMRASPPSAGRAKKKD